MRIPTRHDDRSQNDIAMTPMIDVVFQLMIFFICTASFQAAEELLPTSLAVTSGSDAAPRPEIDPALERIVVRAAQAAGHTQWIVNERPCESLADVRQVLASVAQLDRGLPVVLDVAAEVPLGDMIDVYDISRLTGFQKIQFAAKRR